jgi:hypothetical protein
MSKVKSSGKAECPYVGKMIASIEQSYDGCQLHDTIITFTDGTYLSLMNVIHPEVEVRFVYGEKDDEQMKLMLPRIR